jgi:hypothetical protein
MSYIPPTQSTALTSRQMACQLRRIARELAPARPLHLHKRRVLYKQAHTLSDVDIDVVVSQVGADRLVEALERATQVRPMRPVAAAIWQALRRATVPKLPLRVASPPAHWPAEAAE